MEGQKLKNIIAYREQHQEYVKQFSKRVPIADFKQIDSKRINNQFLVLDNSYTTNEQEVFHISQKGKDRYRDVLTYKHNRIQIETVHNFYINASFMRSVIDNEIYAVFAQAPVKKVIEHFWYACYHYNIKKIIMLCAFQDPVRGIQAQRYWPPAKEEVKFSSVDVSIRCQSQEQIEAENIRTKIVLKGQEGEKVIEHVHWTGWHDMKKPSEKGEKFFQALVQDCIDIIEKKQLILIHCSAGIGRSGTLGTMIEALRCARKYKELSVFEIVDNMRRSRMGCVQTLEQYNFIYNELKNML